MRHFIRLCFVIFAYVILPTYILRASFQQEIQQKYRDLINHEDAFALFDLSINEIEQASLHDLNIDKFDEYDNFGDPNLLEQQQQVKDFLKNLGSKDDKAAQTIAKLVTRLNNAVIGASQKETSWVCLRAFKDTTAFDQPR